MKPESAERNEPPSPRELPVFHEGVRVAVRVALFWLSIASVLLSGGILLARPALTAGSHLLERGAEYRDSALAPLVLFGLFGLGYGTLVGRRISAVAGLQGREAWIIGASASIFLALIGMLVHVAAFRDTGPSMLWTGLAVMTVTAWCAIAYISSWGD